VDVHELSVHAHGSVHDTLYIHDCYARVDGVHHVHGNANVQALHAGVNACELPSTIKAYQKALPTLLTNTDSVDAHQE
jgi:hypothetical protein